MKKLIFLISFIFAFFVGNSQGLQPRSSPAVTAGDSRMYALLNLGFPTYDDTTQASTVYNLGIDSAGTVIYSRLDKAIFYRTLSGTTKYWAKIAIFPPADVDAYLPLYVQFNLDSSLISLKISKVNGIDSNGYVTSAMYNEWYNNIDSLRKDPTDSNYLQGRKFDTDSWVRQVYIGAQNWSLNGNTIVPGQFLGSLTSEPLVISSTAANILTTWRNASLVDVMQVVGSGQLKMPGLMTSMQGDGVDFQIAGFVSGTTTLYRIYDGAGTVVPTGSTSRYIMTIKGLSLNNSDGAHKINYALRFDYPMTVNNPLQTDSVGMMEIKPDVTITSSAGSNYWNGIWIRPNITGSGITADALRIDIGNTVLGSESGSTVIGAVSAASSAILDVTSTTKGFLPPRMTATQASAITPAEGLLVYVTNTDGTFTSKGWWGWSGAAWEKLNN